MQEQNKNLTKQITKDLFEENSIQKDIDNFEIILDDFAKVINENLNNILSPKDEYHDEMDAYSKCKIFGELNEAMRYTVLAPESKRIRPFLLDTLVCVLGYEKYGDKFPDACPEELGISNMVGIALELIHNYSLIHDDLPSMDNDDYRRGRESCHIKYSEAIALLAGNALYAKAIEIISGYTIEVIDLNNPNNLKSENFKNGKISLNIIKAICYHTGSNGMMYGQAVDYKLTKDKINEENEAIMNENILEALLEVAQKKTTSFFTLLFEVAVIIFEIDAWENPTDDKEANIENKVVNDAEKINEEDGPRTNGVLNEVLNNLYDYFYYFGVLYQVIDDINDSENKDSKEYKELITNSKSLLAHCYNKLNTKHFAKNPFIGSLIFAMFYIESKILKNEISK